jgi:hypothetical protein
MVSIPAGGRGDPPMKKDHNACGLLPFYFNYTGKSGFCQEASSFRQPMEGFVALWQANANK